MTEVVILVVSAIALAGWLFSLRRKSATSRRIRQESRTLTDTTTI